MAQMDQLSQDEIDALIFGADEPEEEVAEGGVSNFDFGSHDKIIRGRMPTLEMINERFARYFRVSMFNVMSKSIECSFSGVEVLKFQEFMRSQMVPTSLNLIKINPLRGRGLMAFDSNLIYTAVENFFGGDGRYYTKIEGRDFSDIELSIIAMMRDASFADIEEAWKNIMPISIDLLSVELNPQFANIVSPSEAVIVSKFDVELDGGGGSMYLVLPYSMIEPIKEVLQAGTQSESVELDERWSISLKEEINNIEIEVDVQFGKSVISLVQLSKLEDGDILPVELNDMVMVRSGGIPIFSGKLGIHNGNYAVQAVEAISRPKGSGIASDGASGEVELF
jgi:flagellar motor switch protein FliM